MDKKNKLLIILIKTLSKNIIIIETLIKLKWGEAKILMINRNKKIFIKLEMKMELNYL
jgi:hypothetical protein